MQPNKLVWTEVSPTEWTAYYRCGTYRIKQVKGGVFPRYKLTFTEEGESSSLEAAKGLAERLSLGHPTPATASRSHA